MITEQGLGTRFVMSLGAGVWEETVFRLGIMTGVAVLLERVLGLGRWVAVVVALVVSAVLFSAMHHIPPYGDPLHLGVFVFRVLAGCFFGLRLLVPRLRHRRLHARPLRRVRAPGPLTRSGPLAPRLPAQVPWPRAAIRSPRPAKRERVRVRRSGLG